MMCTIHRIVNTVHTDCIPMVKYRNNIMFWFHRVSLCTIQIIKNICDTSGQYLPLTKVHPKTFKGANRPFREPKAHLISKERHNRPKTEKLMQQKEKVIKQRKQKSLTKLAEMGIEYDYPGVVSCAGISLILL